MRMRFSRTSSCARWTQSSVKPVERFCAVLGRAGTPVSRLAHSQRKFCQEVVLICEAGRCPQHQRPRGILACQCQGRAGQQHECHERMYEQWLRLLLLVGHLSAFTRIRHPNRNVSHVHPVSTQSSSLRKIHLHRCLRKIHLRRAHPEVFPQAMGRLLHQIRHPQHRRNLHSHLMLVQRHRHPNTSTMQLKQSRKAARQHSLRLERKLSTIVLPPQSQVERNTRLHARTSYCSPPACSTTLTVPAGAKQRCKPT